MITNTHILTGEFDYVKTETLDEAVALMGELGTGARPIAGGTDLLVQMKLERQGVSVLVSLSGVSEMSGVTLDDGLWLGGTTRVQSVAEATEIWRDFTALAESCDGFSTMPIKIMATIGGNLCNASPAADTAPALLAFDAIVDLRSSTGERAVPLEEFFVEPGRTELRPDEILRAVRLPRPVAETGSAFLKVARVAADISKVSAAVRLVRDGDRVENCGIAFGSVASTPVRAHRAEQHLTGQKWSRELTEEVAGIAGEEIRPIGDVRSTETYRRHIARVIVQDALATAWLRSGGREFK